LADDDELYVDESSAGVSVRTGRGTRGRTTPEQQLQIRLPVREAIANAEVTFSFSRQVGRRDATEQLSWEKSYPVAWPTSAQYGFTGDRGEDGADVIVELAYYNAEDIPSARDPYMIAANVYDTRNTRHYLILLRPNSSLRVVSNGGAGVQGSEGNTTIWCCGVLGGQSVASASRPAIWPSVAKGGTGGNGGNGGNGGDVRIKAAEGSGLGSMVSVSNSGGQGGPGGQGGRTGRLTARQPVSPDGEPIWYYEFVQREASGRSGAPGQAGSTSTEEAALPELFTRLPSGGSWFDPGLLMAQVE
jgi:hypothetical protein